MIPDAPRMSPVFSKRKRKSRDGKGKPKSGNSACLEPTNVHVYPSYPNLGLSTPTLLLTFSKPQYPRLSTPPWSAPQRTSCTVLVSIVRDCVGGLVVFPKKRTAEKYFRNMLSTPRLPIKRLRWKKRRKRCHLNKFSLHVLAENSTICITSCINLHLVYCLLLEGCQNSKGRT